MNIDFKKLFDRIQLVILNPASAWETISAEDRPWQDVATSILLPLVVASAASTLIERLFFGGVGLFYALVNALVGGVTIVLGTFIASYLIKALTPYFDGGIGRERAFNFVAHAQVPALVGGILTIIPFIGSFVGLVLALYGLYVFYLGVPKMTAVPDNKRIPFMVVSFVCWAIVMFALITIPGALLYLSGSAIPATS